MKVNFLNKWSSVLQIQSLSLAVTMKKSRSASSPADSLDTDPEMETDRTNGNRAIMRE